MNHYNAFTSISLEEIKKQEEKMYLLASKIKPIDKYIEYKLKECIDKKIISNIIIKKKDNSINNILNEMECTIELLGNYWYNGIFQNFKIDLI